jgi:hypothetical protein
MRERIVGLVERDVPSSVIIHVVVRRHDGLNWYAVPIDDIRRGRSEELAFPVRAWEIGEVIEGEGIIQKFIDA